eukprot:363197-Chlamydomonas_euryale.AAC.6
MHALGESPQSGHTRGRGMQMCGGGDRCGRGADETAVMVVTAVPSCNQWSLWFFLRRPGLVGIPVVEGMYSVVSDVGGASYGFSYNSSISTLILVGGFHLMFLLPTSGALWPPEVLSQTLCVAASQEP